MSLLLSDKINIRGWTTLECDADLCLDIEDGRLLYTSKKDIYGVKIKHSNCVSSVIGGDMIENKFEVYLTSNEFDVTPTSIKFVPKGNGVLLEFSENFYQYCLTEIVFYEDGGWVLSHDFNPIIGCTSQTACNFYPKANNDDGTCVYPPKNYDCDGNCIAEIDCNGECAGMAVVDECGVCGGDGSSCPETSVDILYDSDEDIAGFQFNVSGATVTGASGGAGARRDGAKRRAHSRDGDREIPPAIRRGVARPPGGSHPARGIDR